MNEILRYRQFSAKRDVVGVPVYVSTRTEPHRNMTLEELFSRVVTRNEIHELVTTSEPVKFPGRVEQVAYLGFFEVQIGGTLRVHDVLRVDGQVVGHLLGFDLSHYPNHFNLVVHSDPACTGKDLKMTLDSEVRFTAQ